MPFTVKLPADPAPPTTSTVTIGRDAFTDMSVSNTPVQDSTLKVGADGTAHWRSYLQADLSAIPARRQGDLRRPAPHRGRLPGRL